MKRRTLFILIMVLLCSLQLNTLAETEATSTEAPSIALGTKGSEVSRLQERLKELGYYTKSIDGDYGNGTKSAIASFQARNNLESNGIASEETVAAIYSDDANASPKTPNLLITNVVYDTNDLSANVTIQNNTDETVDSVELCLLTYGAGGDVYSVLRSSELSWDVPGLCGSYTVSNQIIRPGGTVEYVLDISVDVDYSTKYLGVYILEYHTTAGNNVAYNPNQVWIVKTDGAITFPTDESEPDVMTDNEFDSANMLKLGVRNGTVTDLLSPVFNLHAGIIIFKITEDSIFDIAGLKSGDIVTTFGDIDALSGHAWEKAKERMQAGETLTVTYYRNGKESSTQIAADMDSIIASADEDALETSTDNEEDSIADQLERVADLYEKGYLTDEEYADAKAKILG